MSKTSWRRERETEIELLQSFESRLSCLKDFHLVVVVVVGGGEDIVVVVDDVVVFDVARLAVGEKELLFVDGPARKRKHPFDLLGPLL